jgi:hypothetical protein
LNALSQLPLKVRRSLATAVAILIYAVTAYVVVGRGLLGDFTGRIVTSGTGRDPSVMMWCLSWFPHAIDNHLDPFMSRAVWWPVGINLAWITSIPGAAILAWPVTRAYGPVASFNVLSFLALPAAAFTAFLLCRHLTGRNRASIVGGYVFGFSPYFLGHLENHLLLILVFPIPLAVLLTVRLLEGSIGRRVFVALMALLLALQIGFSLELFATMTAVGIMALLIGFAVGPEHWRTTVRGVVIPLAMSYTLAAVLVAPYWYYLFAFAMPTGSIISPAGVSTDLLNFLIPTEANLFGAISFFQRISSRFTFRAEAGAWVSWPLLVVIVFYIRSRWHKPAGKVLTVMLALLWLGTLGPRLHAGGHTLFGLPWKIVGHLPLMKSALPARLTMYAFLILAVMTAVILASAEVSRRAKYVLAIAIAIFMTPNLDYRFWTAPIDLPPFFSDGTYRSFLGRDEAVVILPYGDRGNSMFWQADADFYFRMAGGYTGLAIADDFLRWPIVNTLYWGSTITDGAAQLGAFLAAHDVSDIIVEENRAPECRRIMVLLRELNLTPTHIGGVIVYTVEPESIAQYRGANPVELERRYDRDRFDRLIVAADGYLAAGGDPQMLTPARAAPALRTLSVNWTVDNEVYTRDGLILGPWKKDQIIVGVVGSYDALMPLIDEYRPDAAEVYFPFPHPLTGSPKGNTFMRKLVMVFDPAGLARAAIRARTALPAKELPPVNPFRPWLHR